VSRSDFYGLVKKHASGPTHLTASGEQRFALCGARRDGIAWAWVARGLVSASHARLVENVCHNCLQAAAS
jgi:hypothetical protein